MIMCINKRKQNISLLHARPIEFAQTCMEYMSL